MTLDGGDVSYNGAPILTPNIDKLAMDGVQMDRFYAAPTCSPTRAALMTGVNSLENGVIRPFDNPTADRYGLSLRYKIMPEYLKEVGYQTALSGKWHLGMFADEYLPLQIEDLILHMVILGEELVILIMPYQAEWIGIEMERFSMRMGIQQR